MKYPETKKKFIETWGTLGSKWGVNKSIAQIQALLLISPKPLSTDDIMEELTISRGNANMNGGASSCEPAVVAQPSCPPRDGLAVVS